MFKKIFLVALCLWMVACTGTRQPGIPTPAIDRTSKEEQAVYAFLLAKTYQHTGYVIMADTATSATGVDNNTLTMNYVLQNLHGVDANTLDSFRARNATSPQLRPDMQLGMPYTLLSQAGKDRIFSQNQSGWDIFYNRFPQAPGITTFSRVGFNASLDQALVYMGTQSNWLVGASYYILLQKGNGTWSIDQQVMIWVS